MVFQKKEKKIKHPKKDPFFSLFLQKILVKVLRHKSVKKISKEIKIFEEKNTYEIYLTVFGKFLDHTNMPKFCLSSQALLTGVHPCCSRSPNLFRPRSTHSNHLDSCVKM